MIVGLALPATAQTLRRSGFLGVVVAEIPESLHVSVERSLDPGVLVQNVLDNGSAQVAGVRSRDIIARLGEHSITGVADFLDRVRRLKAGDVVTLTLRRGSATVTVSFPLSPRPYEAAPDVDTRYDTVMVDGSLRRTIVTSPKAPGPHPAVLYLNGVGCFSQESTDLSSHDAQLLYGLTRAGYVTMRLEKSGMGDSEGPDCHTPSADFHAEVRGYVAALRALKRYTFVEASAIALIAISIGGVEAPLVAAQEPVRGIVVVNTVAKPFFEYLLETRRRQLALANVPEDEADRRMQLDARCNAQLLFDKKPADAIVAVTPGCADHITFPAPDTFFQQWAEIDPAVAWNAVAVPTLIAYGTSDFVATTSDHAHLAAIINAAHPGNATLTAIAAMDHTLSTAGTMAESFRRKEAGPFAPAILDVMVKWLAVRLRRSG
jgi:pimeloyl-ACP methyl ester carboxylesterase